MSLIDALMGDKGVVVKFKADLTGLQTGIAQAKTDLTGWRDETNKSTADMAKWGAAIGATVAPIMAVGYAAYAAIEKFGGMADEINDLSYVTGMSTDKIQQLQYAATLANSNFGVVTMGVQQLTLSMSEFADESSAAHKAFDKLGIDPTGKSTDQVLEETALALADVKDESERGSLAIDIYKRSWREMLPFLQTYIDKKKEIQSISLLSPQELEDNEKAKSQLDAAGKRLETFEGKAVAFLANINEKYNETQDNMKPGPLNTFLEGLFNPVPKPTKGAGGRKGELTQSNTASPVIPAAVADPFSGLSMQDAEIKNLKDYTIPGLEAKLKDLETSGTATYSEIAAASLDVIKAKQQLIDLTTKETDAQKELKSATEDLSDAKNKLNDIDKDYSRKMSVLNPRDVSSARSLITQHQWDVEDQQGEISKAQGKVSAASGTQKFGDVIVKVGEKEVARAVGQAAGTGERSLTQAGY